MLSDLKGGGTRGSVCEGRWGIKHRSLKEGGCAERLLGEFARRAAAYSKDRSALSEQGLLSLDGEEAHIALFGEEPPCSDGSGGRNAA
ncbi:unnamed protein product, partial [Caenorhabditis auriculariae]